MKHKKPKQHPSKSPADLSTRSSVVPEILPRASTGPDVSTSATASADQPRGHAPNGERGEDQPAGRDAGDAAHPGGQNRRQDRDAQKADGARPHTKAASSGRRWLRILFSKWMMFMVLGAGLGGGLVYSAPIMWRMAASGVDRLAAAVSDRADTLPALIATPDTNAAPRVASEDDGTSHLPFDRQGGPDGAAGLGPIEEYGAPAGEPILGPSSQLPSNLSRNLSPDLATKTAGGTAQERRQEIAQERRQEIAQEGAPDIASDRAPDRAQEPSSKEPNAGTVGSNAGREHDPQQVAVYLASTAPLETVWATLARHLSQQRLAQLSPQRHLSIADRGQLMIAAHEWQMPASGRAEPSDSAPVSPPAAAPASENWMARLLPMIADMRRLDAPGVTFKAQVAAGQLAAALSIWTAMSDDDRLGLEAWGGQCAARLARDAALADWARLFPNSAAATGVTQPSVGALSTLPALPDYEVAP